MPRWDLHPSRSLFQRFLGQQYSDVTCFRVAKEITGMYPEFSFPLIFTNSLSRKSEAVAPPLRVISTAYSFVNIPCETWHSR